MRPVPAGLAVLIIRESLAWPTREFMVPVQAVATGTLQSVPSSSPPTQTTELGVTQKYAVVSPLESATTVPGDAQEEAATFSTHQVAFSLTTPVSVLMPRASRLPSQVSVV